MSSDRELLELAAMAAGISWKPSETDAGRECELKFGLWLQIEGEPSEHQRRRWNPLEDDGDALRLAVDLLMAVAVKDNEVEVFVDGECIASEPIFYASAFVKSEQATDPRAATRRCITRAAAEIQRNRSKA